jgi:hypothetical protein
MAGLRNVSAIGGDPVPPDRGSPPGENLKRPLQHHAPIPLSLMIRFLKFRRGDDPNPIEPQTEWVACLPVFSIIAKYAGILPATHIPQDPP